MRLQHTISSKLFCDGNLCPPWYFACGPPRILRPLSGPEAWPQRPGEKLRLPGAARDTAVTVTRSLFVPLRSRHFVFSLESLDKCDKL